MKKKALVIVGSILFVLVVVFAIHLMVDTDNHTPKGERETNSWKMPSDLNPVKSFGNQQNNYWQTYAFYEDSLVTLKYDRTTKIVKLQFEEDIVNEATIYIQRFATERSIAQVTAMDGWIYFAECETDEDEKPYIYYIYRIKESGEQKEKLGKFVPHGEVLYVLTKEAIVYEDDQGIYTMSIFGTGAKKIVSYDNFELDKEGNPAAGTSFVGVDSGWVYYVKWWIDENSVSKDILYRIKPDGTAEEKILDVSHVWPYTIDGKDLFYIRYEDDEDEEGELVKKTIHGKEAILNDSMKCYWSNLNKDGNWLYFAEKDKAYRINAQKGGEKQLIYDFKNDSIFISDIFVNDGNIILGTSESEKVYIKKDGTVIDLTEFGE